MKKTLLLIVQVLPVTVGVARITPLTAEAHGGIKTASVSEQIGIAGRRP